MKSRRVTGKRDVKIQKELSDQAVRRSELEKRLALDDDFATNGLPRALEEPQVQELGVEKTERWKHSSWTCYRSIAVYTCYPTARNVCATAEVCVQLLSNPW